VSVVTQLDLSFYDIQRANIRGSQQQR
jgi:hypothetical protein